MHRPGGSSSQARSRLSRSGPRPAPAAAPRPRPACPDPRRSERRAQPPAGCRWDAPSASRASLTARAARWHCRWSQPAGNSASARSMRASAPSERRVSCAAAARSPGATRRSAHARPALRGRQRRIGHRPQRAHLPLDLGQRRLGLSAGTGLGRQHRQAAGPLRSPRPPGARPRPATGARRRVPGIAAAHRPARAGPGPAGARTVPRALALVTVSAVLKVG